MKQYWFFFFRELRLVWEVKSLRVLGSNETGAKKEEEEEEEQ